MKTKALLTISAVICAAIPAQADWDPGDGHKMHSPQLPDPNGWDVDFTTDYVFDDWQCSASGEVNDIHFWYSWRGDNIGPIARMEVEIWSDVPAGVDLQYSHPGERLWAAEFLPGEFNVIPAGTGDQGWLAPSFDVPQWNRPDHQEYWQMNIATIPNPFIQNQGEIYWLGLHLIPEDVGPEAGWKTTLDHFNDDATYVFGGWQELRDPLPPNESLDMAFVITPEPGSAMLALLGAGLCCLRRRLR